MQCQAVGVVCSFLGITAEHVLVCGCGLCPMSVLTCMSLQFLVGEY